jgi:CheY-like chemotaxis protein
VPEEGIVLVVEPDPFERDRLGEVLEDAGYEVISCPGPTAPDYTCIGAREGACPLLEQADVVVLDTWLASDELGEGASSDELLELYASHGRAVVALGPGGWLHDPVSHERVIGLEEHPETWEIVAAVRTAPPPVRAEEPTR